MSRPTHPLRRFDALLQVALLTPVVVGAVAAYLVVISPLHARSRQAQARLAEVEELLRAAPAARREHAELTRQLEELESRAETVRRRIPDGPEEAEFLHQIHQAAEAAHFTIQDYRRGNALVGPRHAQLEVRLVGSGDYASICRFFHRVQELPRQIHAQHVVVRVEPSQIEYRVELTLLLFYRAPGADGEKGKA